MNLEKAIIHLGDFLPVERKLHTSDCEHCNAKDATIEIDGEYHCDSCVIVCAKAQ